MFDERKYWAEIQNPATRGQNPLVLIQGAYEALKSSSSVIVQASACCVIIYRYLESQEVRASVDLDELTDFCEGLSTRLRFRSEIASLRWYLSLNMAYANLLILMEKKERAAYVLLDNIDQFHKALSFGQPFTNVVKSFSAFLGLLKYGNVGALVSFDVLRDIFSLFVESSNSFSLNYKFENQWVFEELALVNTILYSLACCHYSIKNGKVSDFYSLLNCFDDRSIPVSFVRVIKGGS